MQSLKTGRLANQGETPVSLRAALDLTKPQPIKLALDGNTTLALDLDKNAVRAERHEARHFKLDGAGFKDLALARSGTLGWDGARCAPARSSSRSSAARATRWRCRRHRSRSSSCCSAPRGQKLELDALQARRWRGRQGADMPFELALDWPQLAVDAQLAQGQRAVGAASSSSGPTVAARQVPARAHRAASSMRCACPACRSRMQGQMQQRKVDGSAEGRSCSSMPARARSRSTRSTCKATLADPGLQPLQLAVRGNARAPTPRRASWKLDGALNTNKFDINGQAALRAARAQHQGAGALRQPRPEQAARRRTSPRPPPHRPAAPAPADTPVALDGLNAVDGQFNVSAASFAFRQYKVADAKIDATLDSGVLRIARLAGRAWGGAIDASGIADAKSKRIAVKLNADNVNVNALLKDVAGKDLLEGTGPRRGRRRPPAAPRVGAMRSNLAGTAALQLRDGAVKGVNLARSFARPRPRSAMQAGRVDEGQRRPRRPTSPR